MGWSGKQLYLLLLFLSVFAFGCASFQQTEKCVAYRRPGNRRIDEFRNTATQATQDLDFALLSLVAYQEPPGAKLTEKESTIPDAISRLKASGWYRWSFLDQELATELNKVHLRVQVWCNDGEVGGGKNPRVVVAFGGSNGRLEDWLSNFRWFIPFYQDQYNKIEKKFSPAFQVEYLKKLGSMDPKWEFLKRAKLYSTGHSLGGGLSEHFAYSWPRNPEIPRVSKVLAFDSSPVTGFFSVDVETREENARGLEIDLIYERGEALAIARSFIQSIKLRLRKENPSIRGVRYALFYKGWRSVFSGHSINQLVSRLEEASLVGGSLPAVSTEVPCK